MRNRNECRSPGIIHDRQKKVLALVDKTMEERSFAKEHANEFLNLHELRGLRRSSESIINERQLLRHATTNLTLRFIQSAYI